MLPGRGLGDHTALRSFPGINHLLTLFLNEKFSIEIKHKNQVTGVGYGGLFWGDETVLELDSDTAQPYEHMEKHATVYFKG